MAEQEDIKSFYDGFSKRQNKVGINVRHYSIVSKMLDVGMKNNSKVLEAGCGVGTITYLLSKTLKKGLIEAFDISKEGVELSKQRVGKNNRVRFSVASLSEFISNEKFDFILLADVLEHIPLAEQENSIRNLLKYSHEKTKLIINIPDPRMNNFLIKNKPDSLQIIDHALFLEDILAITSSFDLKLIYFERYRLHHNFPDYNFLVFDRESVYIEFFKKNPILISIRKFILKIKIFLR